MREFILKALKARFSEATPAYWAGLPTFFSNRCFFVVPLFFFNSNEKWG